MVGGKGGCTFATVKCLLLVVIWQFFLCGFNFSCSWRHCIQISQIRVWSARNDATSDNWVLPIIKCPPVQFDFSYYTVSYFPLQFVLLGGDQVQIQSNRQSKAARRTSRNKNRPRIPNSVIASSVQTLPKLFTLLSLCLHFFRGILFAIIRAHGGTHCEQTLCSVIVS